MKATDLMIGDWYQWYAEGNYYPFQVKPSDFVNDYVPNFEPIPLTAEILEKNGFVKHDKIHPYYMDYYHERDGFTIFNSRTWHGYILNSVHELQHALRLCGLSELADNFII